VTNRLTGYAGGRPEDVEVAGGRHALNAYWKNCLATLLMLWDEDVLEIEKAELLIHNMYAKPDPENPGELLPLPARLLENAQEAAEKAAWYLRQGREEGEPAKEPAGPPKICFERDAQEIYDAFLAMGVDLDSAPLTWWGFCSRLRELPEGCMLARLVHWRSVPWKDLTEGEKRAINRIGKDRVFLKDGKKAAGGGFEPW
jgi:hypothetical protein